MAVDSEAPGVPKMPVRGFDGNLYRTTFIGGTSPMNCLIFGPGCGVVFKITDATPGYATAGRCSRSDPQCSCRRCQAIQPTRDCGPRALIGQRYRKGLRRSASTD